MAERAMRNMHVPAYCPVDFGVHAIENSGVTVEVKNVMVMESIPIMVVPEDGMSMELVELAMDIPDIVLVGEPDVDMAIPDMGMLLMSLDTRISWRLSLGEVCSLLAVAGSRSRIAAKGFEQDEKCRQEPNRRDVLIYVLPNARRVS
jgi:hypothetical protein